MVSETRGLDLRLGNLLALDPRKGNISGYKRLGLLGEEKRIPRDLWYLLCGIKVNTSVLL